jgi:hypothetical protein
MKDDQAATLSSANADARLGSEAPGAVLSPSAGGAVAIHRPSGPNSRGPATVFGALVFLGLEAYVVAIHTSGAAPRKRPALRRYLLTKAPKWSEISEGRRHDLR